MTTDSSSTDDSSTDDVNGATVGNDVGVSDKLKKIWQQEQCEMRKKWSPHDGQPVDLIVGSLGEDGCDSPDYYIAGVDLSFVKGDNVNACAALVVVRLKDLMVVYEDCEMVQLTTPYMSGFLAFREAEFIVRLLEKLQTTRREFYPQVMMVDGNGVLHEREFGLACHLGVLLNMATIGVAKKLYHWDGLEKNDHHKEQIKSLKKSGDNFPLVGLSGKMYGCALRSSDSTTNPVYISVGHMICLESAVKIVHYCCRFRIPEPVRNADLKSREFIRVNGLDASSCFVAPPGAS